MKTNKTKTTIILIALGLLMVFATACSPSKAEKINKEGNDAFAEQAFQEAMALYQAAQIEDPELAEPYYNSANALYRQGQYEGALQQLQMALTFAEDETLAQSSLFNLGNSSYNAQDLGTAVAAYTESLLLNPDDQDAKYNLELALQQQEQQEQEQEQQEQEQEEQEQQEDQESEGSEGEEEQENQDQGEGEEEQEGQEGDQEQEGDQSEQEGDQQEEGQEGEEQQDGQPEDGEEQEGQGQGQPGEEDPNGQEQPNYTPQPGERMTQEQAEQLLAAIAQDSETLQEKLGQIWSVPWRPPVQDW